MSWVAPESAVFDVVDYEVRYGVVGTAEFTDWRHDGAGTRATITGLAEATAYRVQVRAVNEVGESGWSRAVVGETLAATVRFLEGSGARRAVRENAPAGTPVGRPVSATTRNGNGPLRYELAGPDAEAFAIDRSSGQLRTRHGVKYDHERRAGYAVDIVARDVDRGVARIAVRVDVLDVAEPPDKPRAPSLSAVRSTGLRADWTAPSNEGPEITGYELGYREFGAGTYRVVRQSGPGTRTTITGLASATLYEVRVRAVNDEGTGAWSDAARGRTGEGGEVNPVPASPDLVAESAGVNRTSLGPGQSFTLSATVRNRGDASSAATTLRYYRSFDAIISPVDTEEGTDAVEVLGASGSGAESIVLAAPNAPGTYFFGACVDAVAGESNTANNCTAGARVTVTAPASPDLVAESAGISRASLEPGESFTLSATVRNRGGAASASTTLRYYRSSDVSISTSDTPVGTDAVGALAASGTSAESISLSAPDREGTYYYGACVDAVAGESSAANNCTAGARLRVTEADPGAPDLAVDSASVSPNSLDTGKAFTLSATVRNRGGAASASTTLRYYRSLDVSISTSDRPVGTDAVGGLAVSGTSAESIALSAPNAPGTYYYGACVDAVAGESDTQNNCTAGARLTVSEPAAPDLVAESASVSPSSLDTGGSFTLSATVRNRGDASSASTTLRYYRSSDVGISTSDRPVGTDAVEILEMSAASAESIELTAPNAPGTYYYGACVDAVAGESDETNNCTAGARLTVSEPTAPDLVAESASVSPSSLDTGGSFTLSATVRNRGDASSASTTLRYYRSSDVGISTSDTPVGTDAVGALAASGTSAESISLSAPNAPGTYYYGACVDAVAGESDETNNCTAGARLTVSEPAAPDLVVESASVSPSSLDTGGSFTLSATVRNRGDASSASTTLRYYRSSDVGISTSDTPVGTDAVGALAASGTSAESISLSAPNAPGTYYYGACVDAVAGESDETNNCTAGARLTVSEPAAPDLVVESASVSPSSLDTGGSFTLSATVRNRGDASSASTTLRYYRSSDVGISTSDTPVGTDAVGALAASGTSAESISLSAPNAPGTYYYGACVDAVAGESDETNNCTAGARLTVSEPTAPDLVAESESVSPSSLDTGESFTLSATVRNRGDASSASTTLRYYRSSDVGISTSDTPVGTDAVGALAASGTSAESISLSAPNAPGTYYYGACVDAVAGESDSANNCSAGAALTVTAPGPAADLEVDSASITPSSPEAGDSFTLSATVRNSGAAPSASTTLRYYRSSDADISTSDTEVGTDAVAALAVAASSGESIALTAPTAPRTYYYGACVDAVSGESDTTNNCSAGIAVTISGAPDLTIFRAGITLNHRYVGDPFIFGLYVRNEGNSASASTTLRWYRSEDSEITPSDTEYDTNTVDSVPPGTNSELQSRLQFAPNAAGIYYYGVCVDAVAGESDTTNNCSHGVKVTVEPRDPVPGTPDLVVESIAVSPSTVAPGGTFTMSATVRNRGDTAAAATTLRWTRNRLEVGRAEIGSLAGGAQSDQSISLTAPTFSTVYRYGGCVNSVADESVTLNNCGDSARLVVE